LAVTTQEAFTARARGASPDARAQPRILSRCRWQASRDCIDALQGHALGADAFVHLDVISAFSRLQSPSTPQDYVSALAQQFPLNEQSAQAPRPAICLSDWGLQSVVKTAVACYRAGVDHLLGLRLRVVPEASKRTIFW
jgi:hypothetical protein